MTDRDLLLVAGREGLDFEVGQQALDLAVGELAAHRRRGGEHAATLGEVVLGETEGHDGRVALHGTPRRVCTRPTS